MKTSHRSTYLLRTLSPILALTLLPATGSLLAAQPDQATRTQAAPHAAPDAASPERFSATAVNMAAMSSGPVTTPVSIVITRWSTDAEREALVTALREKGPNEVLDRLKEMPRAGSIAATGSVGQEIHFATRIPGPNDSERVILITDRRMGLWELRSGDRSLDYPFTLLEMRIGPDGKGEGKASAATKVIFEPGSKNVVLENWGTQPIALENVRRQK